MKTCNCVRCGKDIRYRFKFYRDMQPYCYDCNELEKYAESNLYLCTGKQEHMLIHGNLEKVSYELIKRGVILFDKEEGKYYINEDAIKEDNDEIHRLV